MQLDAKVPGNATWFAFKSPNEDKKADMGFELMGHKVVDVPDDDGQRILKKCGEHLELQFELRELFFSDQKEI